MKRIILVSLLLAFPSTASFATSYAAPQKKRLYSANKKFYLNINPSTGTHRIFRTGPRKNSLWKFKKETWHASWLISNDGETVVWIAWKFVKASETHRPCIIIYKSNGRQEAYTCRQVSRPRRYKINEVGPVGKFWRVWHEAISRKGHNVVIDAAGGKRIFISKQNGSVRIK